jgi:NADPH:quinone reductase-like Zn-dependent oxidoreductase
VDSSCLALKPRALEHPEAASIPYAGLTAWSAITTFAGLREGGGARVLVVGAAGGVGDLALQILTRHLGAEVTAVVAADAAERAEWCGAGTVLDYSSPEHASRLLQLPRQDVVLECAGLGTAPGALAGLLPLLRRGGRLVSLSSPLLRNTDSQGLLPGLASSLQQLACANRASLSSNGATVRWAYFVPSQTALLALGVLVRRGKLAPPPLTLLPLDRAAEAYRRVEAGHLRGKVVLDMTD